MEIFLCGDVMTGRGIDQILSRPSKPAIHEDYLKDARDYIQIAEKINGPIPRHVSGDYIWGDALEVWRIRKPFVKVVNLETAITTSRSHIDKGINYRMHPQNIDVLTCADIDICTLANNHILDWDKKGLTDTIKVLRQNHIALAGAGPSLQEASKPAILENQNCRILVFAAAHHSSGVPNEWAAGDRNSGVFFVDNLNEDVVGEIKSLIEIYRKPNDIIIFSIHWGDNWGYQVPNSQIEFAHALIERTGVHVVHGHSSHHPRPIEIYKGCPIFYGCGDFINDYEGISGFKKFRDDLVLMYFSDCRTDSFQFRLLSLDMFCMQIHKFRLRHANDEDTRWMVQTLNEICKDYSTKFAVQQKNLISLFTL